MLPPRHALLAALLCCCAFGCAQNNPPVPLAEKLPADAVLDLPDVGLVDPRVVVISAPPTAATAAAAIPSLSATVDHALIPMNVRTVSAVREVVLELKVEGAGTEAELTMELMQPSGSAYEVRSARIGGDAFAKYQVQFVLPVAGTAIDRVNLAGVWTANFLLDGQPLSSTDFELRPQ